jgi:hypothetical protein
MKSAFELGGWGFSRVICAPSRRHFQERSNRNLGVIRDILDRIESLRMRTNPFTCVLTCHQSGQLPRSRLSGT